MSRIRILPRCVFAGAASLIILVLIACGSDPTPTPSPTNTPVPPPTSTPRPTPTPIPPPTATPSPTPEPAPARESFIPQGATIAVDARPSDIFRSPVVEPLLGLLFEEEGTEVGILSEFESETGISLRSLEFMEMYMDFGEVFEIAMTDAEDIESEFPDFGVVLRGDGIDEGDFVERLEEANEADLGTVYQATAYRGYQIHADTDEGSEGFAFSFAGQDTLLLGTRDGIRAMLDVASGATPQISGEPVRALDSLGDRDFGLILLMPEGLPDVSGQNGEGDGNPLAAFGIGALAPKTTVMALSLEERLMRVQTLEFYENESVAATAKEYNEGTMAMVGSMFGSPGIQQLIASAEIQQNGNRVSYASSVDQSGMSAILEFFSFFMELGSEQPGG